ncbi:MAG: metallophosphoesterase family protein [Hyphomicrobiales bacterium]
MPTISLNDARTPNDMRIYAIGDSHGCLDELKALDQMISDDLKAQPVKNHTIIFLGDYVDRGPDSAGCFQYLLERRAADPNVVCLKGNHEEKMVEFLANPIKLANSFLTYGGDTLAASYGIEAPSLSVDDDVMRKFCEALQAAVPSHHLDFIDSLLSHVILGDYMFVHAGIRPNVPLDEQTAHDMMWIRREFVPYKELHEKVIVHGHTPHRRPEVMANRINVDTLCYDTGNLTAVVLEGNEHRFLQTNP